MIRSRRREGERGIAMVTTILVIFVVSILAVAMMYTSFHNTTATARNRSWGQAVHVAESGVHQAIAYLQSSGGVPPSGTVTGTTAEGTYQYRVLAQPRNRYQIDAVGSVGTATSLSASRRLRVTLAPPKSFAYALFSLSDVTTKNNNYVCGDIWANTYVTVDNGDFVLPADDPFCPAHGQGEGNVTAATGYIELENNSSIAGDVWSGGNNASGQAVILAGQSTIGGTAKASSSTPDCTDDPGHSNYQVANGGSITGSVTTWGTVTGSGPTGTMYQLTCTLAAPTKTMPTFTFDPANYPASSLHTYTFPADYAEFNAYIAANQNNLSGTFYIEGGGASTPIDLGHAQIGGDLTVIATSSPIDINEGISSVPGNTDEKIVVLVSFYSAPPGGCTTEGGNPADCAIGIKNNFAPSPDDLWLGDNTSVLLYAPNGPVAFKNNAEFHGAVYAANIQVKNNMNLAYDPRISQLVGFGPTTLDIDLWLECRPGSVTSTSC